MTEPATSPLVGHGEDGAGLARGRPLGPDHGGDGDRGPVGGPALEGLENVSHGALRPLYRSGSASKRARQWAEQKTTVTPSWTACSAPGPSATVMPQTGSTASAGAGTRALAAGVPPGDELGEDGDGDLLLRGRPEVEPGRARTRSTASSSSPRARSSASTVGGPLRAGDEPDVAGSGAERRGEQLLVAVPHGRDDDRVRPLDAVVADPPAHGARERAERARGRALPHDRQERRGDDRLDQHLDDPLGGAAALHAGEPRLAVGERAQRLADDASARSRRRRSSR